MDVWHRERTGWRGSVNSGNFWNGFDLWETYEPYTRYPGKLMAPILNCITPQTTVLDVGTGTGALALPMAASARSVTAVEPSSAQCARLLKKAEQLGLANLKVFENRWEEVRIQELETHDVVTAGYCLFMPEIEPALWKMDQLARRRIFMVHLADHDLQEPILRILGRRTPLPDHRMLRNVLTELGWKVQSTIFTRNFELPLRLQMDMFRYAQHFSDRELNELKAYLQKSGRVHTGQGISWVKRQYRDALISVKKGD
jgi:SAM-dependent methyltransferase